MNWVATVYHRLPMSFLGFNPGPGPYLAFLGRISPEKRPDLAIEISRRSGIPLKIAAKADPVDRDYFDAVIKRLLPNPGVEFIGETTPRSRISLAVRWRCSSRWTGPSHCGC